MELLLNDYRRRYNKANLGNDYCSFSLHFAFGGISLLNSTGIVERLVFGCENNNLDLLKQTASLLNDNSVLDSIKKNADTGITFAKARENAIAQISPPCADILTKPNNILAVQYLLSAENIGFKGEFLPVCRVGAEHDSKETSNNFSSASNIREHILKNDYSLVPHKPVHKFVSFFILLG